MNIIICEDEEYWISVLQTSIVKWSKLRKIKTHYQSFTSPIDLLEHLALNTDADVLFLDITFEQNIIDGLSLAKRIRKMGCRIPIIFVTANYLKAADGYLVEAIGFLTKPIDENRLVLFLDRLTKKNTNHYTIKIMKEGCMTTLYQRDIVYVEIMDHTVTYHTVHNSISCRGRLNEVLEALNRNYFVQIHRSYIIAIDKIDNIKTTYSYSVKLLKNNQEINCPVSRKYIENLIGVYTDDVWEQII